MQKLWRAALAALMLLSLVVLLSACEMVGRQPIEQDDAELNSQQYLAETVYLGVVLSLPANSELAAQISAAHQLAVQVVNQPHLLDWRTAASTGISGYGNARLELVYADESTAVPNVITDPADDTDATDSTDTTDTVDTAVDSTDASSETTQPTEAATKEEFSAKDAAQRLVNLGVVGLVGAVDSAATAEAAAIAAAGGVPMLAGAAGGIGLTDSSVYDFGSWFNRIGSTPLKESKLFFSYLRNLNQTAAANIRNVAIIYADDEFGAEALAAFNAQAESNNFDVVARIAYQPGIATVSEVMQKLAQTEPQVVFHAGSSAELKLFSAAYQAAQFVPQVAFAFNGKIADSEFMLQTVASGQNYWCGSYLFPLEVEPAEQGTELSEAELAQANQYEIYSYLNNEFSKLAGVGFNNRSVAEFAAVVVFSQAVGMAGSSDPAAIAAILRSNTFSAPYLAAGSISFDESGENSSGGGILVNISGGKLVEVFR